MTEKLMAIIRLIVPLIISVAAYVGYDLGFDEVYTVVSTVVAIASFLYCWWWKNNPITDAALQAQQVLRELKESKKNEDND